MKLLAWDTSSKTGALVALDWSEPDGKSDWNHVRLVSEMSLSVDTASHSERLLWAIHHCLGSCGWTLKDVDVFGVGVGPGSFTGLRIGVTTARTIAHTLGKPLIGVSSLAALAQSQADSLSHTHTVLVAATDACKGELFALWGQAKEIQKLGSHSLKNLKVWEEVLEPPELMSRLKKLMGTKAQWLAVGEGTTRYPEAWAKLPKKRQIKSLPAFSHSVSGRVLGRLVWETLQAQRNVRTPAKSPQLEVVPNYLRESDAQVKLKKKLASLKGAVNSP